MAILLSIGSILIDIELCYSQLCADEGNMRRAYTHSPSARIPSLGITFNKKWNETDGK